MVILLDGTFSRFWSVESHEGESVDPIRRLRALLDDIGALNATKGSEQILYLSLGDRWRQLANIDRAAVWCSEQRVDGRGKIASRFCR